MRKSVLLILLLAFVMQGCKKTDPMTDLESVIVSAEEFIAEAEDFGPQTKTSLATSRKVVWSEDDQIAIFQGSSLADRFQVSDESVGNSNGVFSFVGNPGVENGDYSAGTETTLETNVALYPYQDGIECSAITDEEDVVTSYTITGVTIPANQIYAEDSFAEESFIMAAVTEGVVDHNLKFKNVCGAIKLHLKGERTIKSISVAGIGDEVIAGEGVVTVYPDGGAPSVVMDEGGEKVITLDCSEDGGVVLSQEEATVFVITVPPTSFESGFTVTITDVDDNAETFSASAGTSVERSVITVMPEIDLDEEEEITTSAYLPYGETFNSTVDAFMTGKGITEIKFITNSATTSENALVDSSIYLVQNGQTLEIHTAAGQFVANTNSNSMFYAYEGWDNSTYEVILNSFGQIQVIDFGDNFDTQNVTEMSAMFSECSSLTSLDVSKFDTQNVTDMGSMFSNCSSLTSLDVSNFDTQKVTSMRYMFSDCTSLTSLDLSNFDTQNVTDMTEMFYNCSSLTSLDLSNFDTQNVTDMDCMFYGCRSLTSLDLSNFDTQKVTSMRYMFDRCSSLTSLDVSKFNTQNVTDMYGMFQFCSSLTSLDLSNFTFESYPDIEFMFSSTGSNATNKPIPIYVSADGKDYIETKGNSYISSNNAILTDKEILKERGYLPDGRIFNSTVDAFMTGKGITAIKFITNSATTSEDALVDGSIYLVQNGQTLEIHTAASQYTANASCNIMFSGYHEYQYNSFGQIQTIDFGENFNTQNVTNMYGMFQFCSSLTSLDVSKFDTRNVTNMYCMFCDCSSLTSLDVSKFNTQNVTDMYCMFGGCTSLTSLDVSNFDTQNVTDMGYMFTVCSSLTSLDVSNFDTQDVTNMRHMFRSCGSLTSLDVSNFDTQNVTDMYCMFSSCSSLTSLDLSNFDTQNVTEMTEMFYYCSSLTSLDLSNFDTQNVTSMHWMFLDCTSLTSLDLSNFNTQNVTDMRGMFWDCTSLTSLDLSNFDTQNVTDMIYMFSGCTSLTSLDISNFTFESNPDIGSMFYSTGSNATNKPIPIYVSAEGKNYIKTIGGSGIGIYDATLTIKGTEYPSGIGYLPSGRIFYTYVNAFMTGKGITEIKFITNSSTSSENALVDGSIYLVQNGQTLEIHTSASQYTANASCNIMFSGYDGNQYNSFGQIQTIDFGENFNTQNVTDMGYMFRGCTSLTSLDLSNFDTQNVTSMYCMFYDCTSLTSLDVSNFDTQNVTDMYGMFRGCSSLASLDLSNFNTQNVTHMSDMFSLCSNLTSLDLSNFDTQNVTYMGSMFTNCTSLTSLDVSNFNTQNVTDMGDMFNYCSSLTLLDLSNFDTQNVTDMGWMFRYCSSLTSLDLSNFDTQNVTRMNSMFFGCSSLTSLDLSYFDTQNVTTMSFMFDSCTSLTSLDLSSFTFGDNPSIMEMFLGTGSEATNKPIPIYVSAEGKDYIETKGNSYISSNYATLTIKVPQGE